MKVKKLIVLAVMALCMCLSLPAFADSMDVTTINLTVNGMAIDGSACSNPDGAMCLPLLPVAEALGYTTEVSELSDGDAYRVVYTLTPAPDEDGDTGSQLMVAYSIENEMPSAVAISKDQVLLPLKQSMMLVDSQPYMPTEFFETGMCVAFTYDDDTQTLDMTCVVYDD